MGENGDVGQGVRMVLAATVSAVVVAALTIFVGQALMIQTSEAETARDAAVVLVSR